MRTMSGAEHLELTEAVRGGGVVVAVIEGERERVGGGGRERQPSAVDLCGMFQSAA